LEPAEYDFMFQLEDHLWWYVGMRRIVYGMLRRDIQNGTGPLRVLDAGCGTGGSLRLLERFGQVTSFDFEPRAAEMYATRQRGRIMVASTDAIPFADASFDLVTSFDVICQLESPGDEKALQELARVLKPGGSLIVRVPAFQSLYGPHDVTLHTKHRYSTRELAAKIEKAGLRLRQTTYANTFLFPVALVRRMIAKMLPGRGEESDVRPVAAPINTALTAVLTAEAAIIKRTQMPFGLSVIVMAKKP
jgi:SAM-dependent methyltransferase